MSVSKENRDVASGEQAGRISLVISKVIFLLLLFLLVLSAIPYGTWEPWWKAVMVCLIFGLGILAILDWLLDDVKLSLPFSLLAPLLAISFYAFVQTISINAVSPGADVGPPAWNAISADPYSTRFVAIQLFALTIALALFYRYFRTRYRIQALIYVVLAIAVGTAVFGLLRQTVQREPGFVLPLTRPDLGYAQFLNKNHFAFMMEMALGLCLGLLMAGGVRRQRAVIYLVALLPIWMGLVLCNSRGGVLAMLAQVIVAAFVILHVFSRSKGIEASTLIKMVKSFAFRMVLLATLVCALLFGTLWVGGDRLLGNFEAMQSELNPDAGGLNQGATRNEIWRATLKMFAAHPLLGVGLGGYWIAITAYHEASGALTPQEAHNDYLELLSSGGIVGFAIGCWWALIFFRLLHNNLKSTNKFQVASVCGAAMGILGVAVHSLFDYGLHMFANALLFIALVMLATREPLARVEVQV